MKLLDDLCINILKYYLAIIEKQNLIENLQKQQQERRKIVGENNRIIDENGQPIDFDNLHLSINGNNNLIMINKTNHILYPLYINISGNNNTLEISDNNYIQGNCFINIGIDKNHFVTNCKMTIGNSNRFSGFGENEITMVNSNCSIEIGNECMFSNGVALYNTDGHPIYSLCNETSEVSRKPTNIKNPTKLTIGNHVWIGKNATILKGVTIPNDCIIGRDALCASKNFSEEHCVIAGNPAKIVKHNVTWDVYSKEYIENK